MKPMTQVPQERTPPKPAVRLTRDASLAAWVCEGSNVRGFGPTPEAAYRCWCNGMALQVSTTRAPYPYSVDGLIPDPVETPEHIETPEWDGLMEPS